MPVGIHISNAFRQIGESMDTLQRENINYIGIIFPKEEIKSNLHHPKITFQRNPTISMYLILKYIDGNEFSCSIRFSQTLPKKHYEITLYQLSAVSEIGINDTINLTNITESSTYKFNKKLSLSDEYNTQNIYILLKIMDMHKTPVKIDISKNEMSAKFLSLYEEKKLTDFKIICKNQEFCVHKMILLYQSDVFQAMFENSMKESGDDTLIICDFEPKIVEAMIRYLYSDEMSKKLSEEELKQLLLIADKYNLEKLMKICFNELLKIIKTFEQAADFIIFIGSHNFVDMKKLVIQFMKENKNNLM